MARLVGVDLPRDKRMEVALTYIYGIGRSRSKEILEATGISLDLRTRDLTDEDLTRLRDYIEANYRIEGETVVVFRILHGGREHGRHLPPSGAI